MKSAPLKRRDSIRTFFQPFGVFFFTEVPPLKELVEVEPQLENPPLNLPLESSGREKEGVFIKKKEPMDGSQEGTEGVEIASSVMSVCTINANAASEAINDSTFRQPNMTVE